MQCKSCCRQPPVTSSSIPVLPGVRCTPTRPSLLLDRKRYRRSGKYRVVRCSTKGMKHRAHPSSPSRRYSLDRFHPCCPDEQPLREPRCWHRTERLVQGSVFHLPSPK